MFKLIILIILNGSITSISIDGGYSLKECENRFEKIKVDLMHDGAVFKKTCSKPILEKGLESAKFLDTL